MRAMLAERQVNALHKVWGIFFAFEKVF
jgi:hypothetical protein